MAARLAGEKCRDNPEPFRGYQQSGRRLACGWERCERVSKFRGNDATSRPKHINRRAGMDMADFNYAGDPVHIHLG